MQCVVQQGGKAQFPHTGNQVALVLLVALITRRHAAFFRQLFQRLSKRQHGMGWRGEAPFTVVIFHAAPLGVEIQRQRAGAAFARGKFIRAGNHEGKARHALNTFVGGANQEIDIQLGNIHRNTAEAAHRVHDIGFAVLTGQHADLVNWVEHPGGGFAVYHGDMGDRRVSFEDLLDRLHVRAGHFTAVIGVMGDIHHPRHLHHAGTVGTVADNQHLILLAERAAQHRFHSVAAAALQKHGGVAVSGGCQFSQLLADRFHHADIVIIVPGAAIEQHRFFHGA